MGVIILNTQQEGRGTANFTDLATSIAADELSGRFGIDASHSTNFL